MASFADLPVETLLHILRYVSVEDVLTIRQTNKSLGEVTRTRSVWADVLDRVAFQPNIPVAGLRGRNILSLDASQLEGLAYATLHLRRNWTSPAPMPTRSLHLHPSPDSVDHSKVTGLHFIPGRSNRWLLHIGHYVDPIEPLICSTLTCWDLHANPPARCASIDYEPERMSWSIILVNSDAEHLAAFVVSRGAFVRSTESEIHTYIAYGVNENYDNNPTSEPFRILSQYPSSSHPRAFHGNMLFFERSDSPNDLAVQVRHVLTGDIMFLLRVPFDVSDPTSMDDRAKIFLKLAVYDQYIIMFRTRRILMYLIPTESYANGPKHVDPIDVYQWQWRIDSIEYSIPKTPRSDSSGSTYLVHRRPPPITLLVRFDSYYPWPVNLLHHFILRPNELFQQSDIHPTKHNLPYILQPQTIATLASPMRMFTESDMVVGPYGTALWMDAQTDPDPTQAGDHGQRIATRMLSKNTGQPVYEDVTRVLQICETENLWSRLAMDEEEGKVAIGHKDGTVTLLDYGRLGSQ
ncbi:hypothetical protein EIP91_012417 [Steccherinum ochraceum]|uniref:F-box domain-containing protein n=1 Tax=Steccherinum ochraceum TaxID=92696 RepID=A0A4R0RJS4_9APHY|nr:hypothetical protein EIP91_012417 [Steccherinum ochraceum]